MIGVLSKFAVPLLTKAATWGAVVKGSSIVVSGVEKLVERYKPEAVPIVAGFGDTLAKTLDPFDIMGEQKERAGKRAASSPSVSGPELSKKLETAVNATLKKAEEFDRSAKKALSEGKRERGDFLKRQAQSSRRWAQTAVALGKRAEVAGPERAPKLISAAIEVAKTGKAPPMSAITAINDEKTEGGKAIAVSLVDAINRTKAPDFDKLAANLDKDEVFAMVAGFELEVGGSCCLGCSASGGSCGTRSAVPDNLVNGYDDEDDDDDDDDDDDTDEASVELVEDLFAEELENEDSDLVEGIVSGSERMSGKRKRTEDYDLLSDWR